MRLEPIVIFNRWVTAQKWSIRDLEQLFDIIATYVTSWNHKFKIEPVTLLTLVTAFYRDSGRLKNLRLSTEAKEYIPEFSLIEAIRQMPMGETVYKETPASDLFYKFMKGANLPLSGDHSDDLTREYFFEERNMRAQDGLKYEDKSVLLEVQSRVWNAGRHIIR